MPRPLTRAVKVKATLTVAVTGVTPTEQSDSLALSERRTTRARTRQRGPPTTPAQNY